MSIYDIQFTEQDIFNKLKSFDISDNRSLMFLEHELKSNLSTAHQTILVLRGWEINKNQQNHIKQLIEYNKLLHSSIDTMIRNYQTNADSKLLSLCSKNLLENIVSISDKLPLVKTIGCLGIISEENRKILLEADNSYVLTFYTYNLHFAKQFQRSIFNLKKDLQKYFLENLSASDQIHMSHPNVPRLETKVDYFTNVIIPLISNIQQHAFNSENDIYERRDNEDSFNRKIRIGSSIDKKNKEISIIVEDSGFGIRHEIQERIFEKGFSTKQEGGFGLFYVKNFVEANKGKICFETELGRGTSFKFTIPYKKEENYIYRQ